MATNPGALAAVVLLPLMMEAILPLMATHVARKDAKISLAAPRLLKLRTGSLTGLNIARLIIIVNYAKGAMTPPSVMERPLASRSRMVDLSILPLSLPGCLAASAHRRKWCQDLCREAAPALWRYFLGANSGARVCSCCCSQRWV
eukprot:COSAG01_NODE_1398_length_10466_cov_173.518086_17_plen_145_part_00